MNFSGDQPDGSGRRVQVAIKAVLDRAFSLVLLLILLPVLVLIGVLIVLDDGRPVLFVQDRVGKRERIFSIMKFRTMVVDADRFLNDQGAVSSDRRVTRMGSVLRSLSFDELPQLINIIRGEMSFIGPRPVLVSHLDRYEDWQRARFRMKPGITGLAQVRGRNTLPWSERLAADVEYVEDFSLWLDLRILARTVKTVLLREGFVMDRNPEDVDDLPPPRPREEEGR